jgi:hypothetical protein
MAEERQWRHLQRFPGYQGKGYVLSETKEEVKDNACGDKIQGN